MSETDLLSIATEQSEPAQRYPVRFLDRCSLYRKHLFDVDGKVILGKYLRPVSIFNPEIKELLVSGRVRFIYDLTNEYRYIITNHQQWCRFLHERKHGSTQERKYYHVYVDDDIRGKFPIARRRASIDTGNAQEDVQAS